MCARPVPLLLDELEAARCGVSGEDADVHVGVPVTHAPGDLDEIGPELVQDRTEHHTLFDHLDELVFGCLEQIQHPEVSVALFEQPQQPYRSVVRTTSGDGADGATKCHNGERRDGRVLDAAELTIDVVRQALAELSLFEVVLGKDVGNTPCGARADTLDVIPQVVAEEQRQGDDRRDVGVLERLHQVRVVPESTFERRHIIGIRQRQRDHLFL